MYRARKDARNEKVLLSKASSLHTNALFHPFPLFLLLPFPNEHLLALLTLLGVEYGKYNLQK